MLALESGDIEGFAGKNAPRLNSPMLSHDVFELYSVWCRRVGLRALNQPRFSNALFRKHKAQTMRKRYTINFVSNDTKGPVSFTFLPGGHELPPGKSEPDWLGERVLSFSAALKDYKQLAAPGGFTP